MRYLSTLCVLLATAVVAHAAPRTRTQPQIDPRAVSLLARVAAKYENSAWYRGEMTTSFGRAGEKVPDEIRGSIFVTNAGDLDLTRKSKGKVSRIVSDGAVILLTRSDRPQKYVLETLTTPRFKRDAVLLRADCEGFVIDALSRRLEGRLLTSALKRARLGKTVYEHGVALRTVEFVHVFGSGNRQEGWLYTLHIAADDTVRMAEGRNVDEHGHGWIWREKHWNVKLGTAPQPHPVVKPPTGFTPENK